MSKICVYAIAKNEIKFVDRWYESVKEADYICVLDTGSTDGTYEKLQKLGIITKQKKYDKFRFDTARNDSMSLIPTDTDICVCIDLDEIFESGWTKILKSNWNDKVSRARYRYTWNFNPDGSEGIVFFADKIHKYDKFIWKHPVHEVLVPKSNDYYITLTLPNIQLNHHADEKKSRSNYLPLLEMSVEEDPDDDRNMHYLGREYMFYGKYEQAIKTLKSHLTLKSATWDIERSASMRYIANSYKMLGKKNKQIEYLHRAILEANYVREPYFELATLYYEKKDYLKSAFYFNEMLKITNRELNYMSSPVCWSYLPYDYLSMCYYYLKDYKKALITIDKALAIHTDDRLINNRNVFVAELNK